MANNNHRKCSKCGRTRSEDMSVTYHRFSKPGKSNITKASAWAKYCWPNEDWSSKEFLQLLHITNKVLCGRHFNTSQFYDNKRQKLSKFAVPDSIDVVELINNENIHQTSVVGQQHEVLKEKLENIHIPSTLVENCKTVQTLQTFEEQPSTSTGIVQELIKLAETNKNLHIINLDVTKTADIDSVSSKVAAIVGNQGLNLLINNAGVTTKFTKLNLVKTEQLLNNLTVNTIAPIMLTKSLLPLLKQAAEANCDKPIGYQRAVIINMSSVLGSISLNDNGGFYPYRCSKAALNAATKSMSIDLKKDNILVASFHPGWVKTDMGGKNAPLDVDTSIEGIFDTIKKLSENDNGKFLEYTGAELPW